MVQDPAARLARRSDKVLRDPASCTSATAAPSRSDKVVYIVTTEPRKGVLQSPHSTTRSVCRPADTPDLSGFLGLV